ncbi:3'-5' exonuclease [Streptomyces sp. NPDC004082]|uniref:3'-5' exonuclease n=1 Tax=unclassified Streptomyces TaxID=2593676 RepID=UPI0033AC4496
MSTPIAFVDTETTHLDAEIGEAWEVAVILREDDDPATDTEYVWQFSINLETADPESLRIGGFHERRQLAVGADLAAFTGSTPAVLMSRAEAVDAILNILRGAVLVGSNPGFDDRFLRKLLGPGSAQWHYRPVCIATLAAGQRLGMAKLARLAGAKPLPSDEVRFPFSSRDLSRWTGVEPPGPGVAHTALGDARWARDVFDALRGGEA